MVTVPSPLSPLKMGDGSSTSNYRGVMVSEKRKKGKAITHIKKEITIGLRISLNDHVRSKEIKISAYNQEKNK